MARNNLVPIRFLAAWLACLLITVAAVAQEKGAEEKGAEKGAAENGAAQAKTAQEESTRDPVAEQAATGKAAKDAAAKQEGQSAPDVAATEAAFQARFAEWKGLMTHLRKLRTEYQTASPKERKVMARDWDATIANAEEMLPDLIDTVIAAYKAAPNTDRVKTTFLAKVLNDYVTRDRYEEAIKIGRVMFENGCEMPEVFRDAGIAAFAMNDYDLTAALYEKAAKLNVLSGDALAIRDELDEYAKAWETEQALRAKEAEADDLPRVKFTTTKGVMVFELFENEAPGTVGNFISLVKKGFYDGLTFHRVLGGFMAQTGCPEGDGTGGPGYTIYDECTKPGFRKHFRGVLSMAKTNAPNSGGSQFFITFRATPHLNGVHTVFGRVIEGMDVLAKLQRRDPDKENPPEPDKIISAEVIRDRGHEYVPNKVE